ncbi:glycosyltransferase [Dysgonomonas sp. 25]|uniref:glycosyltransferase family 2 protein n=1 Tax=Dysgonomonas sp. 25 TaxID=2302933 RepID=UPI0013D4CA18|nr:glycosyltransferase [Dysgonomonas sp. 25]NDV69034.1 glycosyltransferase [Dysgonomonas sp. 25]
MKISVILITYKQEGYIRQTVESILMQQVDADVEIIVADDSSPDNTLAIIEEYATKAPKGFTFNFLPKEPNMGYIKNYKRAYAACTGKYISILEGDDYWLTNHLQSHVSFLEEHPECSMAFNRHLRLFIEENREEIYDWKLPEDYELFTSERLALKNQIGTLSCCTFRLENIQKLNNSIFEMVFADWLLGMVMGEYGYQAYLKEVTSAYRIQPDGQWSKMTLEEQGREMIILIDNYDKFLDYKYTEAFKEHKRRIRAGIFGELGFRDKIKHMTPLPLRKLYRRLKK